MANHKWKDNTCVKCGVKRERKEYIKCGIPYSVLGRDGCWYDRVPETYHVGWHYGPEHKFERPNCKPNNLNPNQAIMSRQVKFRYRYTDGKHWILKTFTLDEIINGDPFEVITDQPLLKGYKMEGNPDQYTGLKDKNGKKIYEGDILKDLEGIGVVNYKAPQFIVCDKECNEFALGAGFCYPESINQLKDTDIIGNIYEHQNLLNQAI